MSRSKMAGQIVASGMVRQGLIKNRRRIPWPFSAVLVIVACAAGAATPLQGMASMGYFMGAWICAGVFPSNGRAIASTIRFGRELGGKAIIKHHDDRAPSIYHAIELWVEQAKDGAFNAAIADNFGGVRQFRSNGWMGDDLTWQSAAGITPIQRFVYHRVDRDTFRLDWDVSKDGRNYKTGDTLTCKRRHGE